MKEKKTIRTHNGKIVIKDDIQHAFSTIKAILRNAGFKCETTLTGVNTKQGSIERLFQLLTEADQLPNALSYLLEEEKRAEEFSEKIIDIERGRILRHSVIAITIFFALGFTIGKMI